jgi:hypothetical protein
MYCEYGNAGKKRRRNHDEELKFVIQSNDLLTHYSHSVDLTKNDGMTAKQLIRSFDNNKVGMVLTVPQAKTFCKSFNNDTFVSVSYTAICAITRSFP